MRSCSSEVINSTRNQRDTFVEYGLQTRLRLVLPKCRVHLLHGFVRIQKLGSISTNITPSCASEWRRRVIVPHSTRLCFMSKRFQARCLVLEAKTRGRRASHGDVDTTRASGICLVSDCQLCKSSCPNRTSSRHKRMQRASLSPSAAA